MWTISEVKATGKAAFRGNYWPCVLVALLMGIFTGGGSAASSAQQTSSQLSSTMNGLSSQEQIAVAAAAITASLGILAVSVVIKIFLANPINLGGSYFFKSNVEQTPAPFALIKHGFANYWHNFVVLFLRDIYLILWCMLFLVPGFIKMYSYAMVPYILAENPDMPANEVITLSRQMMNGNKGRAFLLDLSFIGWFLLGIVTAGLGFIFWTSPYISSSHAALYLKLKEEQGIA
ncbi:MAG: DUF975 family protein [Oscillospiraceae bacterium]|nr:DUF975 family protein [Oscillospiraceae bacterium]